MKKKFLGIMLFSMSILIVGCGSDTSNNTSNDEVNTVEESSSSDYVGLGELTDEADNSPSESEVPSTATNPETSSTISREYRNALGTANDYLDYSSFSKSGLKEQLIYEGYPDDAAQYAVDTVQTDWNQNAVQTAKDYLDYSSFSDQGLYDQLIYDGYTEQEAQFAINNLPN